MIAWLLLAGCQPTEVAPAEPASQRVVSLAPAITQVIVATQPDLLVGYDAYSAELELPESSQDVGNPRQLSAEGVLSMEPSVVLYDDTAGPPEVLAQLTDAGVRMVQVPHPASIEGVRTMMQTTGQALGLDVTGVQSVFDASCATLPSRSEASALFVYARGVGAMSVSGSDTAASSMLGLAGLRNAVTGYEGYKPLTPESAVAAEPDWVVMTTRGLDAVGGVEGLSAIPGLAELEAVRQGRVAAVDDFQLLAFGLDACEGARALAERVSAP